MFPQGPFSRASRLLAFLCFAVASSWVYAQPQHDRSLLISRIAGPNTAVADDLTRILSAGSRGWEPCLSAPMVVEQTAADGQRRSYYFVLETGYLAETPHLPSSTLEKRFAQDVDRLLRKEGPAPWPIYVFSGPGAPKAPIDSVSLATTIRILVRTGESAPQAASAIVLNSPYWGADAALAPDDPYPAMVARHELYHARRAWTRASEIGVDADALEAAFGGSAKFTLDRAELESLVNQVLIAGEEVAAIDSSITAPGISSQRRLDALQYRQRNVNIEQRLAGKILDLFPALRGAAKRAEARKRILGVFHPSRRD